MNPIVLSVLGTVCALTLWPVPARAESYPKPTVEFSADLVMSFQGAGVARPGGMTGKVYVAKTAERREMAMGARKSVMIMKKDSPVVLVLMPEQKMYMEQTPPRQADTERLMKEGDVTLTKMGTETVNGQATTKYSIEAMEKGAKVFDGLVWLTKENIPVRIEGTTKQGHMRLDHTNIKIGDQDPALFKIPAGYKKLEAAQMRPVPGAGGMPEGIPKDQRQKVEEMMKQMQKQQSGDKSGGDGH